MGILRAVTLDAHRTDEQTGDEAQAEGTEYTELRGAEEGGGRSRVDWRNQGSWAPGRDMKNGGRAGLVLLRSFCWSSPDLAPNCLPAVTASVPVIP